jgi:hypothetical protein
MQKAGLFSEAGLSYLPKTKSVIVCILQWFVNLYAYSKTGIAKTIPAHPGIVCKKAPGSASPELMVTSSMIYTLLFTYLKRLRAMLVAVFHQVQSRSIRFHIDPGFGAGYRYR